MRATQRSVLYLLMAAVAGAGLLWSFQRQVGEWTLGSSENAGRVQFSLQGGSGEHHHFNTSSEWNKADFHGIDWSTAGKHDVHFTIDRDAGKLRCQGFLEGSERSIAKFREKVDHEAVDRAVGLLAAADTIYLIGLRRSGCQAPPSAAG